MPEAGRPVGKASILDGSKRGRAAKGGEPVWVFHWDLIAGTRRLTEGATKELEQKWEAYYKENKNRLKTPINLSFGPSIVWFPVLESDKGDWTRDLTEVLFDESKLSDMRRQRD